MATLGRGFSAPSCAAVGTAAVRQVELLEERPVDDGRPVRFAGRRSGASDGLGIDQPRVAVEVIATTPGGGTRSLGPTDSNTFLLDTGSSTLLAVSAAVNELEQAGLQSEAVYDEQGVAGSTATNVSKPYRLDFAGDNGQRYTLDSVRILSTDSLDFGGFFGIVGMPAMVGRVTNVDMRGWKNGTSFTQEVSFSPSAPPAATHRYHVPLDLVDFPLPGQREI